MTYLSLIAFQSRGSLGLSGIKVSVQSDPVSPGGVGNPAGDVRISRRIGQHSCVDIVTVAQIWLEVAGNWSDGGKDCLDVLHEEFLG